MQPIGEYVAVTGGSWGIPGVPSACLTCGADSWPSGLTSPAGVSCCQLTNRLLLVEPWSQGLSRGQPSLQPESNTDLLWLLHTNDSCTVIHGKHCLSSVESRPQLAPSEGRKRGCRPGSPEAKRSETAACEAARRLACSWCLLLHTEPLSSSLWVAAWDWKGFCSQVNTEGLCGWTAQCWACATSSSLC